MVHWRPVCCVRRVRRVRRDPQARCTPKRFERKRGAWDLILIGFLRLEVGFGCPTLLWNGLILFCVGEMYSCS